MACVGILTEKDMSVRKLLMKNKTGDFSAFRELKRCLNKGTIRSTSISPYVLHVHWLCSLEHVIKEAVFQQPINSSSDC